MPIINTPENRYRKVAIITTEKNAFWGSDYLLQLCKNLSANGIEADVFALAVNDQQPRVINWSDNVRVINIMAEQDLISVFSDEIRGYCKRNHIQYQVIHAMDIDAAYTAGIINDISGTPYIINLNKYQREHFAVIRGAEKIILHSNTVRQQMVKDGFDVAKLTVINDGFDPLDFFPIPSGKARERLSIKANGGLLLYVKNHSCDKNRLMFDAFVQAKERQRHLQMLVLITTDDYNEPVDGVTFINITNKDLAKYCYAAADLFMTNECVINGKSNIIYEAMACGTPVLGVGERMKDCIGNGKTGFIVTNFDAETIAHKIVHVLRDKELMQDMQLNAVIEAHSMHTWKRTIRLVEGIYKKAARSINSPEIRILEQLPMLMTLDMVHIADERAIA